MFWSTNCCKYSERGKERAIPGLVFWNYCEFISSDVCPLRTVMLQWSVIKGVPLTTAQIQHNCKRSLIFYAVLSLSPMSVSFASLTETTFEFSLSVCVSPLSELSQLVAPSQSPPPALTSIPYIYCSVYYLLYESNSLLFFLYFDIYVVLYTESIESMGRRKP